MTLIALRSVLYQSKLYRAGQELPTNNAAMAEAWVNAGSAKWVDEDAEQTKTVKPKARRAAAEPSAEGRSDSGTVEQGKVPKTPARAKKPRAKQ
ncbi:MAG: hypothetical protein LUC83_02960 [Clostridiales bacterium]|nr:hypothetical protein [Clostridiales bacterium]